jgi:hypothetical protein
MTQTPNVLNGLGPVSQSMGVVNYASGSYVGDWTTGGDGAGVNAMTVHIGFTPRYVRLVNMTTGDQYEWMEGMAATKTLMTTASTGANSIDANSVIVANAVIATVTEVATAAPGSGGAGYGTSGTTTVTYGRPDPTLPDLVFNSTAGASGAPVNALNSLYVWMAQG